LRFPLLIDSHFIHQARLRSLDVTGLDGIDAAVEVDLTDDNTNGAGGLLRRHDRDARGLRCGRGGPPPGRGR